MNFFHMNLCIFGAVFSFIVFSSAQNLPTVAFIPGTSRLGNSDGVVVIQYPGGTLGTVCNQDFTPLNAAVLCYLLGYPAVGLMVNPLTPPIAAQLSYPVPYNRMNCTNRANLTDPSTLGRCAVITNPTEIPSTCTDHSSDVAVVCSGALRTTPSGLTTTTRAPVVIPSINCSNSNTNSSVFRLNPPNGIAGRLEYNNNGDWGTVCIEGTDSTFARLVCQSLCFSSTPTNYSLARVVANVYGQGPSTQNIVLSGIRCPTNAISFSNCSYSGTAGACGHFQDVGIECLPMPAPTTLPAPAPLLQCTDRSAIAYFLINTSYSLLNESLVTLNGGIPSGCGFSVTNNGTYVIATIPYSGCNAVLSSNSTFVRIQFTLLRNVYATNGVYLQSPYTVPIVCDIFRNASNTGPDMQGNGVTLAPVDNTAPIALALTIYSDSLYTQVINPPAIITVYSTVYVKVYLTTALITSRLILQNLWATVDANGDVGDKYFIVRNKCPTTNLASVLISFTSDSENHVEFPMFLMVNLTTTFYLHASGYICNTDDQTAMTSSTCFRSCNTTVLRRRRDISFEEPSTSLFYLPQKSSLAVGPFSLAYKEGKDKSDSPSISVGNQVRPSSLWLGIYISIVVAGLLQILLFYSI